MKGKPNANFLLRFANNVLGHGRSLGLFLAIVSALINISYAGTAVLTPSFSGFSAGTFSAPPQTLVQNWSVKSGWFYQSADVGSLAETSRMSAQEASIINKAINGAGMASMSGARSVAVSAMKGGIYAAVAGIAIQAGLTWLNNKWEKNVTGELINGIRYTDIAYWYNPSYLTASSYISATSPDLCQYVQCPISIGSVLSTTSSAYQFAIKDKNSANVGSVYAYRTTPKQPVYADPTSSDWDAIQADTTPLTDQQLKDMAANGLAVPVGQPNTVIGDFSALSSSDLQFLQDHGYFTSPNGADYPMDSPYTDPVTGQSKQTMLNLQAEPNAQVQATTYDSLLNPDGTPQTDANNKPIKQQNTDPCSSNPGSLACTSLGNPSGTGPTSTTSAVTITPVAVNMPGSCPAPVTFATPFGQASITYDAVCSYASYIKPVVILLGTFFAGLIFVGGLKS